MGDGVKVEANGWLGKMMISLLGVILTGLVGYAVASVQHRYTSLDADRDWARADQRFQSLENQIDQHAIGPPHRGVVERLTRIEVLLQSLQADRVEP